jgi:hypothetical protein
MSSCTEIKKIDVHQLLFLVGIKYCRCVMGVKQYLSPLKYFVSLIPAHGKEYLIQHYLIKFW